SQATPRGEIANAKGPNPKGASLPTPEFGRQRDELMRCMVWVIFGVWTFGLCELPSMRSCGWPHSAVMRALGHVGRVIRMGVMVRIPLRRDRLEPGHR